MQGAIKALARQGNAMQGSKANARQGWSTMSKGKDKSGASRAQSWAQGARANGKGSKQAGGSQMAKLSYVRDLYLQAASCRCRQARQGQSKEGRAKKTWPRQPVKVKAKA